MTHALKEEIAAPIRDVTVAALASLVEYEMGATEYAAREEHLRGILRAIEAPTPHFRPHGGAGITGG